MTIQKYMTFELSAAANTKTVSLVATQDDNIIRTVTGIWCNDTTKLVVTGIQLQGKDMVAYDDFFNSLLKNPLECKVPFPAGVQIGLVLNNGTAAAVNNVNITLRYEIAG